MRIPFNKPYATGQELPKMQEALRLGHISGDGVFTRHCHKWFETHLGCRKALLTTSCTHALEMSALLLDIRPGDEVIVPSFTFVSTVNAFVLRGAKPIFVDVRPDTFNLDERLVAERVTDRTRAIVPVHYAGVACEMDALMRIATERGIPVVEDNAHGLLGRYRGRLLGTFGALSTLSFHETKNLSCGEGGALILNDARLIERAEILREKGTDRSKFFRGQVDKYGWVDLGSSYLPSDLLAAYLHAQLEASEMIQKRRREIWETYAAELGNWAAREGVQLPTIPAHCEQAYHMFYLVTPSLEYRTALISHLKTDGILSAFHYQPLHLSPMGTKLGGKPGDCPVTEQVADRLLRLPFYFDLTAAELESVVDRVKTFRFFGDGKIAA